MNDSLSFKVRNGWKKTIKVYDEGIVQLYAKTLRKTKLEIDVKKGQEYYIKCYIGMGVLYFYPKFVIVNNEIGALNYNSLKTKQ